MADSKDKSSASERVALPMSDPEGTFCYSDSALLLEGFARGGSVFKARKISQTRLSCIYTSTVVSEDSHDLWRFLWQKPRPVGFL